MKVNKKAFGERVREIRMNNGLSQEKLGELFENKELKENKANKGIVSAWERGESVPSPYRLKIIAELGDLTVEELLHGKTKWQQYDEELLAKDPNALSKLSSSIDKYEGFVAFLSSLGYEVSSNDEITIISKDNQQYELTTDEYMKLQQDIENFTNYNISNLK